MLIKDWRHGRKYCRLQKVLKQWRNYSGAIFGEQYNEEEARADLTLFFEKLLHCRPDKKYCAFRTGYYSFLINFLPLEMALDEGKYALACHELETLFAYEPVLQERIYFNLLRLYKKYLLR